MEAKELRNLTLEELEQKSDELREDLFKLRMRGAVRSLENPARLRQLRRDIARVETVKRELSRKPALGGGGSP
ncbi:MAG: 50S ribosomal protein L29 [candidate division NC10 bacterium]|nr:50S ribosomal protein L29 [candidate division NC10 bacterium]